MQKHTLAKFKYYSILPEESVNRHKTVIIYHGWGGTAEGYKDIAEELSKEGYQVIIPEIVFHDTRQPLDNHFDRETTQQCFWRTIFESIDEFNDFVTELVIQKEEIVVAGSSMGGFIANGIFARETSVSGLANINGSGSFLLSEKLFREKDGRGEIPLEEVKKLKQYDPVTRVTATSPVLLIHGDADEIISIEGQKDYYRHLTESEKRKKVEFKIHKDVNHVFTAEMAGDLIGWLKKTF
ncbi:alpha/beta fold hydrolase [Rossellomorea oryzaecorticis]|uniref:Alpha/beta fold hydrolase n=1 Tax=Rossellomorea oryzaecorticis TaxID=1396505 RepID=A0ABU9KFP7_9BACI